LAFSKIDQQTPRKRVAFLFAGSGNPQKGELQFKKVHAERRYSLSRGG
jgi:hypothetical protein